jgi:hypothetical protein
MIVEFILQVLAEFVLQVVAEFLTNVGLHLRTYKTLRGDSEPWLAALGYTILGAVAGLISVLVFPSLLIHLPYARLANLLVTPLLAGASMSLLGAWRRRREQQLIRLDMFACGYLFALAMALVRLALAK